MPQEQGTVLILGALGLLGRAAVRHFTASGWRVIGLARRSPDFESSAQFVSLDLTDREACRRLVPEIGGVTHVVYAALFEKPDLVRGWRERDQIETNLAMLRNAFEPIEDSSPRLRHITLLQGTKAYGAHVEPARVPAKERWPRHQHENFYWEQEDWLRARQRGKDWSFTILRPQAVLGHAIGSPMNVVAAIAVYGAIMRELGRPFSFPGGGRYVCSVTDSNLFASALEWAATDPRCRGETYNITNGDVMVWQDLWPSLAEAGGLPAGPDQPMSLTETMPGYAELWDRIVARHNLQPHRLDRLISGSWQFADRAFAYGVAEPPDTVLSTIKCRQHGFHDCVDTEDCLTGWLRLLQEQRIVPRSG